MCSNGDTVVIGKNRVQIRSAPLKRACIYKLFFVYEFNVLSMGDVLMIRKSRSDYLNHTGEF